MSIEVQAAARRRQHTDQNLEKRRLACAVRAGQTISFAGLERDLGRAEDGASIAIAEIERLQLDCRCDVSGQQIHQSWDVAGVVGRS